MRDWTGESDLEVFVADWPRLKMASPEQAISAGPARDGAAVHRRAIALVPPRHRILHRDIKAGRACEALVTEISS